MTAATPGAGVVRPSNKYDASAEHAAALAYNPDIVICNLGIRLAPSYGKQVMNETKATAKQGYDTLMQRATFPLEQQFPNTMPSGAGNKPWRVYDNPFLRPPVDPVEAGPAGPLQFN